MYTFCQLFSKHITLLSRINKKFIMYVSEALNFTGFNQTKPSLSFSATFKSSPCISRPDFIRPSRPLFDGACSTCTPLSRVTLVNADLTSSMPIKDSLSPNFRLKSEVEVEHEKFDPGKRFLLLGGRHSTFTLPAVPARVRFPASRDFLGIIYRKICEIQ